MLCDHVIHLWSCSPWDTILYPQFLNCRWSSASRTCVPSRVRPTWRASSSSCWRPTPVTLPSLRWWTAGWTRLSSSWQKAAPRSAQPSCGHSTPLWAATPGWPGRSSPWPTLHATAACSRAARPPPLPLMCSAGSNPVRTLATSVLPSCFCSDRGRPGIRHQKGVLPKQSERRALEY